MTSIEPELWVERPREAIAFYEAAFGAAVLHRVGDGDDIEINGLGADSVTSATAVGKDWLAAHARTVDGKTVLDVGGKERTLPRADLAQLIRHARSS